jgi:hypothetical protein
MDGNALMQRREEVLAHYHSPTRCRQAGRQAGREAFTQARLVLAAALYATTLRYAVSALCRPLVALILSPSPISRLGHAVFWPQLQVRRYLHTPTDALTLLGPNASPSCYSTHFYS